MSDPVDPYMRQLRETQQSLQQTLERFNALYHRSPIGYVTIDAGGKIQELNESFANMLGHPENSLRRTYLASYCSTDGAEVLRRRLPALFKSPQGQILDLCLINNAGATLLVEIQGQKLPGEESLACSVIDRTERKQAEEARKDSEAQLRAVTSAARNAILMTNSNGLITYANPACERVLGYHPDELLGQHLHELLVPEHYLPDYHRGFEQFRRDGKGHAVNKTIELTAIHKNGKILDIEVSLSAVAIKGEWHGVGIVRDITKIKNNEQELKLNRDRLKNWHHLMQFIIHHDPNAIAVLDRNLHFLFVSDRFLQDYGVTRETIIGKHHYEIFPDIPERWRIAHQRALAGEVQGCEEDEFVRDDGAQEYTRWLCRPWYDIDGNIGGIILYTEVITERKKMEKALISRTAELEQRTEELERFNYTVSHDLKSPLVTVKTFLGFLAQDMRSGDPEAIDQDFHHIRTATDRMNLLLDDLLSFSRLGWIADQPEPLSLKGLLEHTLMLVQGRIQESGAQISLPDTDLILLADRSRILEIWQNLIDNALTYGITRQNPHIQIGFEAGSEPVFYVRDYGPGIPSEFHEKIFGLFEKLERNGKGSGIGLALVKRLVAKQGGEIWVESEGKGKGSCFKFTLPAAVNHHQLERGNDGGK